MSKILGLIVLVLTMSAAGTAFAGFSEIGQPTYDLGTSEPQGVFCEINSVKLFARTAEDCEKAGGAVTHVITKTVTPAGDAMDNPEQVSEIQREKNKEPVAP